MLTGSLVMVKPGVMVQAFAPQTFDPEGNLIDDEIKELLRRHLDDFAKWTLQLVRPREFVRYACEMDIQLARAS